jgi:CelD/BcsL family acetyltransferase involved in cellulose biosynthesis
MTWQFDWITSWDEIWSGPFVARWHEWMKSSPTAHVFFHPALVRAWVDSYMPLRRIEPRFLVATQEGCTIFLPMVLWRRNWKNAFRRLLVPVGNSDYDYHDPIIVGEADCHSWQRFWDAFLQEVHQWQDEYDTVELTGIHQPVACMETFVQEGDICPWCDLSEVADAEAFLASLNKSLRGDLRRQERRLSEIGEIGYHVFRADEISAANEALNHLLSAHRRRWPQAYKAPGFHANLVRQGLSEGIVHFSLLKVGGEDIAWHLGFVYASRFYYYMPAHHDRYARLSPGKILLYYCVKDAIASGLKVFDHLRGPEDYKAGWTNQADRLYMLCVARTSLLSKLRNVSVDRIRPAFVRLVRCHRKRLVHE